MAAKNVVAKDWVLTANYDGTLDSRYPNGDKPGVIAPTLGTPIMGSTTASVPFSGGANYTILIPQYRLVGSGSWESLPSDTSSPLEYAGLTEESVYEFRALADGTVASNTVNGTTEQASNSYVAPLQFTPTFLLDAEAAPLNGTYMGPGGDQWTEAATETYSVIPGSRGVPAFDGARVWECNIAKGEQGFNKWGGIKFYGSGLGRLGVVHVQWSVWFPNDFSFLAAPYLKFFRVRTATSYGGSGVGHLDIYIDNDGTLRMQNEVQDATARLDGNVVSRGQWETFELRIVLDSVAKSSGGSAEWSLWQRKPGQGMVRIGLIENQVTLGDSTHVAENAMLWTYWNSPPDQEGLYPIQTQRCYNDRIVVCTASSVAAMDALLVETDAGGRKIVGGVTTA